VRTRTAAILGCFILALGSTPANAKKKKRKSASLGPVVAVSAQGNNTTAPGQRSSAIAVCPPGTIAVGGGFTTAFMPGGGSAIAVDNSFRSSSESWQATGENVSGTGAVTAHVYCRRGRLAAIDVEDTAPIAGAIFAVGNATASCPGGTQLIGGGFQTTRGPNAGDIAFPFVNSRTGPRAWTVSSANNTTVPQTLTAHAYCMAVIKPPTAVTGASANVVPTLGQVSAASATCPIPKKGKRKKGSASKKKGKRKQPRQVLSAGGFSSPAPGSGNPVSVYIDSRAGTGVWLATAVNGSLFSTTGAMLVSSQGICV
jgi:hypothetical protein